MKSSDTRKSRFLPLALLVTVTAASLGACGPRDLQLYDQIVLQKESRTQAPASPLMDPMDRGGGGAGGGGGGGGGH